MEENNIKKGDLEKCQVGCTKKEQTMSEKIDKVNDSLNHLTNVVSVISSKFDDDGIIQEIRREVRSTNGKVASQEAETAKLREWRNYLTGAFAVLGVIVVSILIPLTLSFFKQKTMPSTITKEEFANYLKENNIQYSIEK